MLLHYLKVALRNLLKYPTQSMISMIGLSVGMLCFSICFYCSRFIESTDTSFQHYKRLAEVHIHSGESFYPGTPATLDEKLKSSSFNEIEALTRIAYMDERPYNVQVDDRKELPYTFNVMEVDTSYHRLFSPVVLSGNWEDASQAPNSVVLTASMARTIFGENSHPIGRQMTLAKKLDTSPDSTPRKGGIVYTIRAVIQDLPTNTSMNFMKTVDLLTMNDSEGLLNCAWRKDQTGAYTYLLLTPGKTKADLNQHLQTLNDSIEIFGEKHSMEISTIGEVFKRKSVANYFSIITGVIGMLILLAGLLNFFHFQIGSFFNRTREYSIRKVTGANGRQLFTLLFMQLLLTLLISFLILFSLIEILSPYLQLSLFNYQLVISPQLLTEHTLQYFALLIVFSALISGFITRRIGRISVQVGIRGNRKGNGKHQTRNIMLGIQFFICWIFITFTFALYLQAQKTGNTLFGTLTRQEKESILSVPLDYSFMKNEEKQDMIARIRKCAGIKDVLLSDIAYTQGVSGTGILTEKDNKDSYIEVNVMQVSPNFFSFMNVDVIKGETLKTGQEMLVDKVFADKQKEEVLGRTLYNYSDGFTVCGVSETFFADVYHQSPGFIFLPTDHSDYIGHCYVKCYPGREKEVEAWIDKVHREMLPESITPQVTTLLEEIEKEQAVENSLKGVILFFSIVSILITLLGVYSAITLDTERRQKEVAVRKINGAGAQQIILLFARLYLTLLVATALVAFPPIAFIFTLWKQMYTVFFDDGVLFWGSLFGIVAVLTAITVLYRIVRIIQLNPAEIIKNE